MPLAGAERREYAMIEGKRWNPLDVDHGPGGEPESTTHARIAEALRSINERLLTAHASEEALEELAAEVERLRDWLTAAHGFAGGPEAMREPLETRRAGTDALAGRANAVAPPMRLWRASENELHGTVTFGIAYAGAPGCVHGGMIAAAFDHILGASQGLAGFRGMTGTLTVRYRRPTPLFREAHFRSRIERRDRRKLLIAATLHVDGVLRADAEGLFIAVDFSSLAERLKAPQRHPAPSPTTARAH